jgi:hypothetical protein
MLITTDGVMKFVLYILLFPTFFQETFIEFAWAAGDPVLIMTLKRLFLLLPVFAIILGCWVTVPALMTVLFRSNRKEYINSLFITWWDLGKAIFSFWGGIFQFLFNLVIALVEFVKILIVGIGYLLKGALVLPFKLMGSASRKVVSSNIPWIAVFLTLVWVLVEATIFTYVTTPLVVDTLTNITGEQLSIAFVRIPLFLFLFFIVMGSYAVLSTFVDEVKNKNIFRIAGIAAIEIIVLLVEVIFLYREFVDALVPWFALYATDFEITMTGILAVSAFMWFGIRSLSWFLFAAHGTPTIMSIIQGKGLGGTSKSKAKAKDKESNYDPALDATNELIESIKKEVDWVHEKGEQLLASFMLPPLQVVAAAINFCTLLVNGNHLFDLPFKNLRDIKQSKSMIESISKNSESDKVKSAASHGYKIP